MERGRESRELKSSEFSLPRRLSQEIPHTLQREQQAGQAEGQGQLQQYGVGPEREVGEQQQGLRLFQSQRQRRFKWHVRPVFGLVPDPRLMAQSGEPLSVC